MLMVLKRFQLMVSIHFSLNLVCSNGPKILPINRPDYPISSNLVFDNFILAVESLPKVLQSLKACALVTESFKV